MNTAYHADASAGFVASEAASCIQRFCMKGHLYISKASATKGSLTLKRQAHKLSLVQVGQNASNTMETLLAYQRVVERACR